MKKSLVSVLLFAFAGTANARCGDRPETLTKEFLLGSQIVAYGTVIEVHDEPQAQHESYALLRLQRSWKGDPPNPLRVYHSDSVHGYQFQKDKSYLVFVDEYEERVVASFCSETCEVSECEDKLKLLGSPTKEYK